MKRFGINFMDTIYATTFTPLLECFLVAHKAEPEGIEALDRKRLTVMVNTLSPGFYLLRQSLYRTDRDPKDVFEDIQIRENQILIDKEVDAYFLETGRHWDVFYWVDFETKLTFCI